jgi:hypothetical protein
MKKTNAGYKGILTLIEGSHGPYGNDISPLQLDVRFETSERLHVKIWAPGRLISFFLYKTHWNHFLLSTI